MDQEDLNNPILELSVHVEPGTGQVATLTNQSRPDGFMADHPWSAGNADNISVVLTGGFVSIDTQCSTQCVGVIGHRLGMAWT